MIDTNVDTNKEVDTDKAIELIRELIKVEVKFMKQMQSPRGVTKKTAKLEKDAATALFTALTGKIPSVEQVEEMIEV